MFLGVISSASNCLTQPQVANNDCDETVTGGKLKNKMI